MFRFCCEMKKYQLLLFLLILPCVLSVKEVRKRRPLKDQLALASTRFQDSGAGHINYVVTILPKKKHYPTTVDDQSTAESSLSDSVSAEEYVSKALGMRTQFGPTTKIPTTHFANYNLVEQQNLPIPVQNYVQPNIKQEIDYRPMRPNQIQNVYQVNSNQQKEKKTKVRATDEYAVPQVKTSSFHRQFPVSEEEEFKKNVMKTISAQASGINIQKSEVLSQIDASVKKFMNEMLEKRKREEDKKSFGHFYSSGFDPIFTTSKPKYDKEKYRSQLTTISPIINSQESHIKVMHPSSAVKQMKLFSPNYDSISSNVDLTIKNSKKRQKPIDLTALDVGQSWSHSTSFDHSSALKNLQGFDQSNALTSISHKPKIHLSQETYHEINSLPYKPDVPAYNIESPNPEHPFFSKYNFPEPSSHIKISSGGSSTSVGATMSFGKENQVSESMETSTETSPIQIINGIAVSNPYKVDMNTIRYMLGGLSQAQVYQTADEEAEQEAIELMKQRYKEKRLQKEYEKNAQNAVQPYKIEYPKTSTKSKLPYDSYNPKYENSENESYYNKLKNNGNKQKFQYHNDQTGLASSGSSFQTFKNNYNDDLNFEYSTSHRQNRANDMSTSPSNHRPVYGPYRARIIKNKATSKSGIKIDNKSIKKFKALDTELRPPPLFLGY